MSNNVIIYKDESYSIMSAVFEVYKEMGSGFLEAVYQECLELELSNKKIPFIAQPILRLRYKTKELEQTYKPDFICYNKIIIELKSVVSISKIHQAQVLNYLKATDYKLGLIINFGTHPKVEVKRIVL